MHLDECRQEVFQASQLAFFVSLIISMKLQMKQITRMCVSRTFHGLLSVLLLLHVGAEGGQENVCAKKHKRAKRTRPDPI